MQVDLHNGCETLAVVVMLFIDSQGILMRFSPLTLKINDT